MICFVLADTGLGALFLFVRLMMYYHLHGLLSKMGGRLIRREYLGVFT